MKLYLLILIIFSTITYSAEYSIPRSGMNVYINPLDEKMTVPDGGSYTFKGEICFSGQPHLGKCFKVQNDDFDFIAKFNGQDISSNAIIEFNETSQKYYYQVPVSNISSTSNQNLVLKIKDKTSTPVEWAYYKTSLKSNNPSIYKNNNQAVFLEVNSDRSFSDQTITSTVKLIFNSNNYAVSISNGSGYLYEKVSVTSNQVLTVTTDNNLYVEVFEAITIGSQTNYSSKLKSFNPFYAPFETFETMTGLVNVVFKKVLPF